MDCKRRILITKFAYPAMLAGKRVELLVCAVLVPQGGPRYTLQEVQHLTAYDGSGFAVTDMDWDYADVAAKAVRCANLEDWTK